MSITTTPQAPLVELACIPEAMQVERRWVVWRYERRADAKTGELKWTKVPYQAGCPTYKASTTNPKTWGTFAQAEAAYAHGDGDGVGFVLGDDWAGTDLDHCINAESGNIHEWALEAVRSLDSYAERSPSGGGVHILVHGKLPGRDGYKLGDVEAYSAGRFFTVTGHHLPETPATVEARQEALEDFCRRHFPQESKKRGDREREHYEPLGLDDEALVAKAMAANDGGKFRALWDGDASGYPSHSEAVAALLCKLAFWTGKDAPRVDRLFRQSGLMSEEWEEKRGASTWGECEIDHAIEFTPEVYDPKHEPPGSSEPAPALVLYTAPAERSADDHDHEDDRGDGGAGGGAGEGEDEEPSGDHEQQEESEKLPPNEEPSKAKAERPPSQATQLVGLVSDAEFFHDSDLAAWVTVAVGAHRETWQVRSRSFRLYLEHRFYQATARTVNAQAMQEALGTLEGRARFEGESRRVWVRLAEHEGTIYLDLADEAWRAVKITASGWELVGNPPVKFRRPKGMLALPAPVRGGSLDELRPFVNVALDKGEASDWKLLVGWLVAALRPAGPFPILDLCGEMGSAKTTLARVLRALVDPNGAPVRAEPKEVRDLAIAASNSWAPVFDNLSGVPNWLSNALCRLSTGGGSAYRTLYENDEETIFDAQRPVILTGIEEVATKEDLVDRCLFLSLPTIAERRRRPESTFWQEFEAKRPRILGALLEAVASALANLAATHLETLPRMADFALWVTAAEKALGWTPGTFVPAYNANRAGANALALEASAVGEHLGKFMDQRDTWDGTPTELHVALSAQAGERVTGSPSWPKSARGLSGALKHLAPNLRRVGIYVEPYRRGDARHSRAIAIRKGGDALSGPSEPSEGTGDPDDSRSGAPESSDATSDAKSSSDANRTHTVRDTSPGDTWDSDGSDGSDATSRACSNGYQAPPPNCTDPQAHKHRWHDVEGLGWVCVAKACKAEEVRP